MLDAGRRASLALLLLLLSAGCHRRPVVAAVPRPAMTEEHCWWAVVRSPLPPDAVAERFAAAFGAVGLTNVSRTRAGDTIVVRSGPSALAARGSELAGSRVVAYPRGDSTHLRHFVAFAGEATGRWIGLCRDITRAAGVGAVAPRAPTGEEALPVWRRGAWGDTVRP